MMVKIAKCDIRPDMRAYLFEFLGTMLFALYGSSGVGRDAPWTNGLALAALLYATDGGHLNCAVTFSAWLTGYIDLHRCAVYIVCQILGAMVGVALGYGIIPFSHKVQPGCFQTGSGVTDAQLFAWETIMTFLLVLVVQSIALRKSGFANPNVSIPGKHIGGLMVGLTLTASALAGGNYTGAALNPARALAPIVVYTAARSYKTAIYIASEFFGALLASCVAFMAFDVPSEVNCV
jgi:glycerol uptake facilitator-like aquaporin